MNTLDQQLRKARQEGNTEEVKRIKEAMGIMTRNIIRHNVFNRNGQLLSNKVSYEIVPLNEQRDSVDIDTVIGIN